MTKTVTVMQELKVTVDEARFTDEFMEAFSKCFFQTLTIEEHIEHIAEMFAKGVVTSDAQFLEGYGVLRAFGITIKRSDEFTSIDDGPIN